MPVYKIQKRNGSIVDFNETKITKAIFAAAKSVGSSNESEAKKITEKVLREIAKNFKNQIPSVENIQDIVEETLIKNKRAKTAKAFILYRERRSEIREDRKVVVEVEKTMDEYLQKIDWRVNANSNQSYSLGGLILNTAGKVTANYWLSHIYPRNIGNAHRNGDFHIHDLDMLSGYCAGWSLRQLLEEGFNGKDDRVESAPPRHFSSAISQMVNFLGTLQNEWAGAQAFSSFDTYLAPFVKKYSLELEKDIEKYEIKFPNKKEKQKYIDEKTYEYTYQNLQSFVFNLNVPSRWGTQTPFTNITLDWNCPEDLKDKKLKLGGEYFQFTFGELQKEMDILNKAYLKVMANGDAKGRVFTFPIPTYNITKDFDLKNQNTPLLFELTAKYGLPYFQNFINSNLEPNHVRSMCCRLRLDLSELLARGNGLFGSAEMTGSIGVVTINLARIGFLNKKDKKEFFARLSHLMELAKNSLEIKRKEISAWLEKGLFPYTKRYLPSLRNHFSTIGINGMNEAIRNFTKDKNDISDKFGQKFAEEVLYFMRKKMSEFQEETGNLYNLEATPAEGTTYRFAKEDKNRFTDIIQAGDNENPYYTNSSQLPADFGDDVFQALEKQKNLQKLDTGGTVFHVYLSERVSDFATCQKIIFNILKNYRIPYLTITPTFSICPNHGYLNGEKEVCPKCKKKCEVWTRVMGYHRPVKSFNRGKKAEFGERENFVEGK